MLTCQVPNIIVDFGNVIVSKFRNKVTFIITFGGTHFELKLFLNCLRLARLSSVG